MQGAFKRWEMTSFGDERPSTLAARIKEKEAEERAAAAAAARAQHAQQFAAEQAAAGALIAREGITAAGEATAETL